jgi:sodium/proline symporter
VAGAAVDLLWLTVPTLSGTGLYEIIPGFAVGSIAAIATTLIGSGPGKEVEALYDESVAMTD